MTNYYSCSVLIIMAVISAAIGVNDRMRQVYSWRTMEFRFPNDTIRQSLVESGEYVPTRNVPLGMEIWRDRFFITIPRWLTGIASTLNYFRISDSENGNRRNQTSQSPVLIPYPDYESNYIRPNETNAAYYDHKIVSVFRLKVDACDRLWFVDTGLIDIVGTYSQVVTPRLFIVDLRTDRLVRRYTLRPQDLRADTLFGGNIVVDVSADSCNAAFAYLPDFGAYRMVVYDYANNASWQIKHPYFYFDPFASIFSIGGITFTWTDGVFGAALSAPRQDGFRTLYFTAISSNYQFAVSTRFLRDRSIATNITTLINEYRVLGSRVSSMQTTSHMFDERTGILFYTLVNRNGMGCWNSIKHARDYSPRTNPMLVNDDETMIFPNDIILQGDNLWLLSDRLPVSNVRGLSAENVNFRLFSAPISELVRGTVCDPNTRD